MHFVLGEKFWWAAKDIEAECIFLFSKMLFPSSEVEDGEQICKPVHVTITSTTKFTHDGNKAVNLN